MIKVQTSFLYCIALLALVMAWGCASIIEGTTQAVSFNSEPPGAQVIINDMPMGVTPATITLKKSEYYNAIVVFRKDGYLDQHAKLNTKYSPWYWGNIVGLWISGSITDDMSGAMWEYSPDKYFVTLPPMKASSGERARLEYENKVRKFLLFSHEQLVADLARGGGEMLSSLCTLLDVNEARQASAILELRILATSADDAPTFAVAVLRQFRNG